MVTCPLCEDYEGTRGQVIAHASSKVDEDHKGVGGQQMKAMLDAQDTVDGSGISESVSENPDEQQQTSEEASGNDGSTDPTSQTPPSETTETESGNSDEIPDDCPNCGAELVDVRETDHLRHESGRDVPIPDRWDYVCSDWCRGGASGFEVDG